MATVRATVIYADVPPGSFSLGSDLTDSVTGAVVSKGAAAVVVPVPPPAPEPAPTITVELS